ncbi:DUF397 domain-containing protein [Sphaerisporangium sp. NPDC088356]|uniref:DUF397 domain-containing protein n=1 Tax=Sphaerisporangium sp. NPDC088356 TaxID=3154871 RepID=UPI003427585C
MDETPHMPIWRKSSHSGQQDNCVDVADIPGGGRAVRDSKKSTGPTLVFTTDEWNAFISAVKTGRFATP